MTQPTDDVLGTCDEDSLHDGHLPHRKFHTCRDWETLHSPPPADRTEVGEDEEMGRWGFDVFEQTGENWEPVTWRWELYEHRGDLDAILIDGYSVDDPTPVLATITSLRLQVEEGERERAHLRRQLGEAIEQIGEFRRECDPGERLVLVTTLEMLGASAASAPIEMEAPNDPTN